MLANQNRNSAGPFDRALVLGGTGLIGSHAVRSCHERKIAVRVLSRPGSDRRTLQGLELELFDGALEDKASLEQAVAGCDLVIHAAAPYPKRHFGKAALLAKAQAGMNNFLSVLNGPAGANLKRVIYVSSVTTIGIPADESGRPAPRSRPARETDLLPIVDSAPYFALKEKLESTALSAAANGLPIVVVNPTFCVGPYDAHRTTAQLMIPLARKQIPAYIPGKVNAVAANDVGEGISLAAERGQPGKRYILGGENMTSNEFMARCANYIGVNAPERAFPIPLAECISYLTELWAYATRSTPLFPMTGIRMMKFSQEFDISLSRRELGYQPGSINQAIEAAYEWYREDGQLK